MLGIRPLLLGLVLACVASGLALSLLVARNSARPGSPTLTRGLPLAFEANRGQADRRAQFVARSAHGAVALTRNGAIVTLPHGGRMRVSVEGARSVVPRAAARLAGVVNSFVGPRSRWRGGIPTYGRVEYPSMLRGLDLSFHGSDGRLEYDLTLAPGRSPDSVALALGGVRSLRLASDGALVGEVAGSHVRQLPPRAFQLIGGRQVPVASSYRILGRDRIGFRVGRYDRTRPLVIDPVLVSAGYLGGSASDLARGATTDGAGALYVVGRTSSADFPLVAPADGALGGTFDGFVTKFNPDGSVAWSTYLGGSSADSVEDVTIGAAGDTFITGFTGSRDFPTVTPFQANNLGMSDAFVTKLTPAGELAYSSYLGGSGADNGWAIAVDGEGSAYVAGTTNSQTLAAATPVTALGPGGGSNDMFVAKVDAAGKAPLKLAKIGGTSDETPGAIAVDSAGSARIIGSTNSIDFPTASAFRRNTAGGQEGVVFALDSSFTALTFSTYLGGSGNDTLNALALDGSGNVYFAGSTQSSDFPKAAPSQATLAGSQDAVVGMLAADGRSLPWSTLYGGAGGGDAAVAIGVGGDGNVWIAGTTNSSDLTRSNQPPSTYGGMGDAYLAEFAPDRSLAFGTYFGGTSDDSGAGLGLDSAGGGAWLVGNTASGDLPIASPAQGQNAGSYDVFLAHYAAGDVATVTGGQPLSTGLKPVFAASAVAYRVAGTVKLKPPSQRSFAPLAAQASIPVGTLVDASRGRVQILIAGGDKTYTADFYRGVFKFTQPTKLKGIADMLLAGGKVKGACRRRADKFVRRLWADAYGPFRTTGRFSSATAARRRGMWLTEDRCESTLTRVKRASAVVRDFPRRTHTTVKAPKHYLARAR